MNTQLVAMVTGRLAGLAQGSAHVVGGHGGAFLAACNPADITSANTVCPLAAPLETSIQGSQVIQILLIIIALGAVMAMAVAIHEGREGAHPAAAVKALVGLIVCGAVVTFIGANYGLL
jgi:hypothetical protein